MTKIDEAAQTLEERAQRIRPNLIYSQRAFVLEFAGTPKSGKSTAVEAIRHFFSREGYRVHVLAERAGLCPIPMKGHLFFNTWCATSMLAELLANVDTDTDVIIVDRGIFDALVWLRMQARRGEITTEEKNTIEAFLLLDRWRSLTDLTVAMRVDAEAAMDREIKQRITSKPGSVMKVPVLIRISEAVTEAISSYRDSFNIVDEDTTLSEGVRQSNISLANKILDAFEEFLNPNILVVSRVEIERLPLDSGGSFNKDSIMALKECLEQHGTYMRRADAEKSSEYVQIVVCGVLVRDDQVFLFQRKESDPKSRLYGQTTVWHGTHVIRRDMTGFQLLKSTLKTRVTRSLFLNPEIDLAPAGYCWDRATPESERHFGVLFKIIIDDDYTANDLQKKEFRKGRRKDFDLTGQFIKWEEIERNKENLSLEPWSTSALANRDFFRGVVGA